MRQGAFTGTVRPHNRVDFTGFNLKVNAFKNGLVANANVKIFYAEHVVFTCVI
jgi:hypothetical protein